MILHFDLTLKSSMIFLISFYFSKLIDVTYKSKVQWVRGSNLKR